MGKLSTYLQHLEVKLESDDTRVEYPYKPVSSPNIAKYKNQGLTRGQAQAQAGQEIPKIISGYLTYNLGAEATTWGGAIWIKGATAFIINSAFIETSFRLKNPDLYKTYNLDQKSQFQMWTQNKGGLVPKESQYSSLVTVTAGGAGGSRQSSIYPIFYNYITNGGFSFTGSPSIIGGQKMFIGDTASLLCTEYNHFQGSVNNYFVVDPEGDIQNISQLIPDKVWKYRGLGNPEIGEEDSDLGCGAPAPYNLSLQHIGLFDTRNKNFYRAPSNSTMPKDPTGKWNFDNTRKYLYLCGGGGSPEALFDCPQGGCTLFKTEEGESKEYVRPEWQGLVINSQTNTFLSPNAKDLGDLFCRTLSKLPRCMSNADCFNPPGPLCNSNSPGCCSLASGIKPTDYCAL